MARQVTLKQVASHAGVSYQTVSKVINHQVHISKETEDRIWKSVHELGYRPNLIARSLRSNRSYMIGYSWEPSPPENDNNILDQFIQSMATAAGNAGYHMLAFPHRNGDEWISGYRELIDTNRVDGFVLYSVEFDDPRVKLLKEYQFPFVAFGRSKPGWDFPYVDVDGTVGMRAVVKHLVEQGYRKIAVLAWPEESRVGKNRMEGITQALNEASIPLPSEFLIRGEGIFQFGLQATQQWLDLPVKQRPDAIVAFNDLMAVGAMRAIQDRGLTVGKDLAVTGFDDMPLAQYINPSLTSIRQPIWEVGQRVLSILIDLLEGNHPEQEKVLVDPVLIIRESSQARVS